MTADTCPTCGGVQPCYRCAGSDPCSNPDAREAALVEALREMCCAGCGARVGSKNAVRIMDCFRCRSARTLLADLPAAARERAEERERLRGALKLAEWGTEGLCGACEHPDQHQHEPGCLVAKALAGEKANR